MHRGLTPLRPSRVVEEKTAVTSVQSLEDDMSWRSICLGAIVAALLGLTTFGPAEAGHFRHRAHLAGIAPHHSFLRHHHRFHRHRFAFIGVYPYYYGEGCYWLKRRAIITGSHFWWRRYYACRYGY